MSTGLATTTERTVAEVQQPTASMIDAMVDETIKRQTLSWKVAETGEQLDLSISHVRKLFANPTKSGALPTDRDCWLFLHLCKARGLNPYIGDAFLVGYDSNDGPSFSLITAHQALLKRAEMSGKKDGMESGVIVVNAAGEEQERNGDFFRKNQETLVGGWAKVYRKDWKIPAYERLSLESRSKPFGRWRVDPSGMIVKCAEASAHRLAFPQETAGMYVREEMGTTDDAIAPPSPQAAPPSSKAEEMAARFTTVATTPVKEPEPVKTEQAPPEKPTEKQPEKAPEKPAAKAEEKPAASTTPPAKPFVWATATEEEKVQNVLERIVTIGKIADPTAGMQKVAAVHEWLGKVKLNVTSKQRIHAALAEQEKAFQPTDTDAEPDFGSDTGTGLSDDDQSNVEFLVGLVAGATTAERLDEIAQRWEEEKTSGAVTEAGYQAGLKIIAAKRGQ